MKDFYTPTDEWVIANGLLFEIDYAAAIQYHSDEEPFSSRKSLHFTRSSGEIILSIGNEDRDGYQHTVFCGWVPSEDALDQLVIWTNWNREYDRT